MCIRISFLRGGPLLFRFLVPILVAPTAFPSPHFLKPYASLPSNRITHKMSASGVSFIGCGSFSSYSQIRPAKARITASAEGAAVEERKRSLYKVLRVKETATAQEIKAAYRALAKRYHPDVGRVGDGKGSEFMEIRGAYETLSDPEVKARYDRMIGRVGFYQRAGLRVPTRRWETDQCW